MSTHHQAHLAVHIRWMIRRDMRDVLGIESSSFEFLGPKKTSCSVCDKETASAW